MCIQLDPCAQRGVVRRTFVDVSEHVHLGLHPPLDGVQQLHASDTLHLLGDPVQEACGGQEVRKATPQVRARPRRRSAAIFRLTGFVADLLSHSKPHKESTLAK